jgi:hypothetical protein
VSQIRNHAGLLAQAAVAAFLIVKPGNADNTCVPAAAATDKLVGTADGLDKAIGEIVDVPSAGIGEVRLGGNVTRGDPLTSDAAGKAVVAAPAAGANARIIGFAAASGVADDVIQYHISLGVMQG